MPDAPDLVHELTEHNAPRKCAECGDPATVYLLDEREDETISKFYCDEHVSVWD